jgi:hypothetical protein
MSIELVDLYWAAGFLEGEGSFQYKTSPRVSAAELNPEDLEV